MGSTVGVIVDVIALGKDELGLKVGLVDGSSVGINVGEIVDGIALG